MATVAHSTLTGSNLHENKGAAAASDNTVATITSGATVWKKLDNTNLAALGNPLGASLLHVREEQPSGTNSSSTITPGIWNPLVINTVKTNEVSGSSLASNRITLLAGTYFMIASATFLNTNHAKLRFRNVTDVSTALIGRSGYSGFGSAVFLPVSCQGRFTLVGTKDLELQVYESASGAASGTATNSGEIEVYTDVMIWRIA